MDRRTRDGLRTNKYLWLTLSFAALLLPWTVEAARSRGAWVAPIGCAYGVLGLGVVNAAARSITAWRMGGFNDARRGWLFNTIDIALISIGVSLTGGVHSEMWLLYFVLLCSEAIYASKWETVALIGLTSAGYVGAVSRSVGPSTIDMVIVVRLLMVVVVGEFLRHLSALRHQRQLELATLRAQVAASDERSRIAREVHDGLGHALVSSILRLELCARIIDTEPTEAKAVLADEVASIRSAWDEARDMAFHLRPWDAQDGDLVGAINRNLSRFAQRTGLVVERSLPESVPPMPTERQLALLRIIQEALTNIARHSQSETASVTITREPRLLRCTIVDRGIGFDPERVGFGLDGMRERAGEVQGACRIISSPGNGTTIDLTLPI